MRPILWQNLTDSGSPPCSPQMPSLMVGAGLAALGRGHLHQLPDARLIEGGEGVLLEDARLHVGREELVDVVSADAEGGLGEVVGSEAEELGLFGDLIRGQSRARQFDHRANHVIDVSRPSR